MQTTRGTPLTDRDDDPVGPSADPARSRLAVLGSTALFVVVVDQLTKAVVVATRSGRPPIDVVGTLLRIQLVRNPGAAFGIAQGYTVLFTSVAVVVVVAIVRTARRMTTVRWAVAFGLILGGAIGNLIDRLVRSPGPLRGRVVDWIRLPHWPVFNLADSAIVVGVALALLLVLTGVPFGRTDDGP
jgi:lipoprotein signal peptidase